MLTTLIWFVATFAAVVAGGLYYLHNQKVGAINYVAALDARCDTAFADIDVHLKHRHDLIPRLVEVVKGQTAYEREMVGAVGEARIRAIEAMSPDIRLQAEKKLSAQVVTLLSSAEKQPDLQALPEFRKLREELIACDERITASRRFYNLAIEEYNAALGQWPTSQVADRRHLTRRQPFDLGIDRLIMEEPQPLGL
jgi:LemA protein